jgi:hypothetical protein
MVGGLCAGVIAAWQFGDAFASRFHPDSNTSVAEVPRLAEPPTPNLVRKPQPLLPAQPVYPYSVVSGGVHSRGARIAMRFDPVVAAHFADFDLSGTRVERVAVSRAVYVSFRSGPRVAWTSRRVTMHPGETILTDGQNQARTRCGNRIKEVAPAEISKEEPPPEVFDTPLPSRTIPIEPLVGYELLAAEGGLPPLETQDIVLPAVPLLVMPPPSCRCRMPQPPIIPVIPFSSTPEVPEPGTLLLVSPALGLYASSRRLRRRRSRTHPGPRVVDPPRRSGSREGRSIRPEGSARSPGSACGRP